MAILVFSLHVKDQLYYLRYLSSWHKKMVTEIFKIFFSFC